LSSIKEAAAGSAWRGLKKVGIGKVLAGIQKLVKPMLDRVLKQGIGRLPPSIQPLAQQLAQKLGLQKRCGRSGSGGCWRCRAARGAFAALPDFVLDNQELLEGVALVAFEYAAAANLPALFPQAVCRQRPELLEGGVNCAWVLLPLRGRKRYKRCTQVFKVRVSPHMATEVESFEGAVLSDYLRDQLGVVEGDEVEAELSLYKTLPGTSLADIAHGERERFGSGLSDEANAEQLHR
jgi:hypothetical protein